MRWLGPLVGLLMSSLTSDATRAVEPKRSLPIESDAEGWASSGFRMALGYAYGWERGFEGLPDTISHAFVVRAGARIDQDWSLLGTLQYAIADGDLSALSYLVTIDPTWHVGPGFELAIGLGFGGLVGAYSDQPYPNPDLEDLYELEHSLTLPDATHPIDSCDARGPAALGRVGWRLVLDEIWSVALHLEGHLRWMACEAPSGELADDTGEAIVARQWWGFSGVNLGLTFGWR